MSKAKKEVTAGEFEKTYAIPTDVKIRFAGQFVILINDEIVAPDNVTDRLWKGKLNPKDKLEVICDCRWTMEQKEPKWNGEIVDPESMVEIVPEGELSMLERAKQR